MVKPLKMINCTAKEAPRSLFRKLSNYPSFQVKVLLKYSEGQHRILITLLYSSKVIGKQLIIHVSHNTITTGNRIIPTHCTTAFHLVSILTDATWSSLALATGCYSLYTTDYTRRSGKSPPPPHHATAGCLLLRHAAASVKLSDQKIHFHCVSDALV